MKGDTGAGEDPTLKLDSAQRMTSPSKELDHHLCAISQDIPTVVQCAVWVQV